MVVTNRSFCWSGSRSVPPYIWVLSGLSIAHWEAHSKSCLLGHKSSLEEGNMNELWPFEKKNGKSGYITPLNSSPLAVAFCHLHQESLPSGHKWCHGCESEVWLAICLASSSKQLTALLAVMMWQSAGMVWKSAVRQWQLLPAMRELFVVNMKVKKTRLAILPPLAPLLPPQVWRLLPSPWGAGLGTWHFLPQTNGQSHRTTTSSHNQKSAC